MLGVLILILIVSISAAIVFFKQVYDDESYIFFGFMSAGIALVGLILIILLAYKVIIPDVAENYIIKEQGIYIVTNQILLIPTLEDYKEMEVIGFGRTKKEALENYEKAYDSLKMKEKIKTEKHYKQILRQEE